MIDFIANNALLAPIPVSVLISAFLFLIVLFFWIIPLEKRVKRSEYQLLALQKIIRSTKHLEKKGDGQQKPKEFSYLYKQTLSEKNSSESDTFHNSNKGTQEEKYNSDLGRRSIQRRDRINKT